MKHQLILTGLLMMATPSMFAQSYFEDDIYYNPSKDKSTTANAKQNTQKNTKQSNYIANYSEIDVDTYNRRDLQYYSTPADTIGQYIENGEDFVYTQEIQKYYDPTIVVDNADVLAEVLENSYGNVEIVINSNGVPVFAPAYSYYSWPYYSRWGWSFGPWGWNVGFYDPWYAWGWGPSWSWSWSWGPAWAWGPSWGWGGWAPPVHHARPVANWRPNGNRPVGGHAGWSAGARPGTRSSVAGGMHHAGVVSRPGSHTGVVKNNGKWEYVNRGNRNPVNGGTYQGNSSAGNRYGNSASNSNQSNGNGSTTTNRGTRSGNNSSYNNSNSGNSSNRSYNSSRSYGSGRSSGGSYRGGSRGTVGGGSRGGRGGGGRR